LLLEIDILAAFLFSVLYNWYNNKKNNNLEIALPHFEE